MEKSLRTELGRGTETWHRLVLIAYRKDCLVFSETELSHSRTEPDSHLSWKRCRQWRDSSKLQADSIGKPTSRSRWWSHM